LFGFCSVGVCFLLYWLGFWWWSFVSFFFRFGVVLFWNGISVFSMRFFWLKILATCAWLFVLKYVL
ncbi:hypothetical protein ACTHTN_20245, partial [Neisseria sp. P0015.S006]